MVRTRLLNLALLAALLFAVSRLVLFLAAPPPVLPVINSETTPPAEAVDDSEQKTAPAAFRPETYDVIVARDLFSPTRGVVPPAPVVANRPAPRPQPAPKLTLYGVVILDGEKTAFIQEGTQTGQPRKVREKESFAGGVVNAIRPDGITFLFAGSEISVPLRTPKAGAGAPPSQVQDAGNIPPQSEAPVAFPRRQVPPGVPQGMMPQPGRPMRVAPGMPMVVPPGEPGSEEFGNEEFPEGFMPGDEAPAMPEEEEGE